MNSFGTFFKLGSRFLGVFGVQRFIDDDEASDEYVQEGKSLISREKRRRLKRSSTSSLQSMTNADAAVERLASYGRCNNANHSSHMC